MNNIFYQHQHPVEGCLRFELDVANARVRFFCDWPYDLSTNEWIALDVKFPAREFSRKINHLSRAEPVMIRGVNGSRISFKVLDRRTIEFDVKGGTRMCHDEFRFPIPAQPRNLTPMRNGQRSK